MTRHHSPSDDLDQLGWQLRTSLENLDDDFDGPDARDFRRFLHHALTRAWRFAAQGDFSSVRRVIDLVREARPVIDDALPRLEPRALAAVEVQQALAALYLGEDELREVEIENRLSDRGRHPTERAVLEVLAAAERPLRQQEVHDRMPEARRPSPSRVGQILREIYDHGFTSRQLARARGASEVAHYSLAPRGVALCKDVGLERQRKKIRVKKAASIYGRKTRLATVMGKVFQEGDERLKRILSGFCESVKDDELGRRTLGELDSEKQVALKEQRRETQEVMKEEVHVVRAPRGAPAAAYV